MYHDHRDALSKLASPYHKVTDAALEFKRNERLPSFPKSFYEIGYSGPSL